MLRQKVFIVTSEFKLVYKLMDLSIHGVKFKHVVDTKNLTKGSKIIVSERGHPNNGYQFLRLHPEMSSIQLKQKIYNFLNNSEKKKLTIGIDPGVHIGLALIQDNNILSTTITLSLDGLVLWIRNKIKQFSQDKISIKVGDGITSISDEILLRLHREFASLVRIFVVDESFTSYKESNTTTIHEQAAIRIAKRRGLEYHG